MIEGSVDYNSKIVQRLHKVLRPFILRRLKSEVEKQLPPKVEKVVKCPLSKRQRYLYNEFMSLRTTKESLSSGSMVSVLNIVMQLRKCCNHPNLFEPREVETPLCPEIERIRFPRMVVLEQNGIDLRQKLVANGSRILQGLKIEKEKGNWCKKLG
uniref:SNF2_N domain-containing protein n=1 Tax=Bursaphelenchus xylophilus TaxID=6326 RepID=A0A1I7SNJ4_BURXY